MLEKNFELSLFNKIKTQLIFENIGIHNFNDLLCF
jgi:hypothetical protein